MLQAALFVESLAKIEIDLKHTASPMCVCVCVCVVVHVDLSDLSDLITITGALTLHSTLQYCLVLYYV